MTLVLVRCSIEADQQGTVSARARVSLVSWEWGSHAVLFMVPLSHSVRGPWPKHYGYHLNIIIIIIVIIIIIMYIHGIYM